MDCKNAYSIFEWSSAVCEIPSIVRSCSEGPKTRWRINFHDCLAWSGGRCTFVPRTPRVVIFRRFEKDQKNGTTNAPCVRPTVISKFSFTFTLVGTFRGTGSCGFINNFHPRDRPSSTARFSLTG